MVFFGLFLWLLVFASLVFFFLDFHFLHGPELLRQSLFLNARVGLLVDPLVELADGLVLLALLGIQDVFGQVTVGYDALDFATLTELF